MSQRERMRAFTAMTLALATLAAPLTSSAQPPAERLDEQLRLNEEARLAAGRGERLRAAELLRASIDLGPLNVTWLNLGRVYALDGRCKEALDAFDAVPHAPQVQDPPPEVIDQALARYREEMAASCFATLLVTCQPDTLRMEIDGQARRCGEPTRLLIGDHRVRGSLGAQVVEEVAALSPGERAELTLRLEGPPRPPLQDTRATPADSTAIAGWIIGGLGVAAASGGAALRLGLSSDLAALEAISKTPGGDLDRFTAIKTNAETRQLQAFALIGLGAALTATGAAMLLFGPDPTDSADQSKLRLLPSPAGVVLEGEF